MSDKAHAPSGCTWTRQQWSHGPDTWTRNADRATVEGTATDALAYDAAHPTLFHRLHALFEAELREKGTRPSVNGIAGILGASGSTYTRYHRGQREPLLSKLRAYADAWAEGGGRRYVVSADVLGCRGAQPWQAEAPHTVNLESHHAAPRR